MTAPDFLEPAMFRVVSNRAEDDAHTIVLAAATEDGFYTELTGRCILRAGREAAGWQALRPGQVVRIVADVQGGGT